MKKLLSVVLILIASIFMACDSKDSDEAKEYERQQALDKGNFDKVLSMTQNCGSDEKCKMDRAAAYAGRAGFTVADVIAGLSTKDGDSSDKFYKKLGKGTVTANNDLASAKSAYEVIIAGDKNLVCDKSKPEYKNASYYQQAACFPHAMVVMASSAVRVNDILDKYSGNASSINLSDPTDEQDLNFVADLINNDLGTIINLFGAENAETVEEINRVKEDICTSNGGSAGCTIDKNNLKEYLVKYQ